MASVNKITLLGRLGKDPEIKYTPSGVAVADFSIATSEFWKDKNTGAKQEKTHWHNCTAFARTAEVLGEYVKKGDQIYIEGSLDQQSWDDKDSGQKRYKTVVKVSNIQLLGGKQGEQGKQQAPTQAGGGDFSDDIPFAPIKGLL